MDDQRSDEIDLAEILGWSEFCSWAAFVMTPLIWWLQGPSVSTNQFVVRMGLVAVSSATGLGLRMWAVFQSECDLLHSFRARVSNLRSPSKRLIPDLNRR